MDRSGLRGRYDEFRINWLTLTFYERFEQIIALIIAWLVAVIIIAATWELAKQVLILVGQGIIDPLDYKAFQLIFGEIMIVLIALEFKHSIIKVVAQRKSIIQVRTVILVALLAISRKFIILEADTSPANVFALASVVVALGLTYWLLRD